MKILTRKKQNEILKLLAANEIIAINSLNTEDFESFIDNSANAVYAIGGIKGMQKVRNTVENWIKVGEQNE